MSHEGCGWSDGRYVVSGIFGLLRTDIVIMGIVVIGVVAYIFDLLMFRVERTLVPWKGRM